MPRPRFSRIKTAQKRYNELQELIKYQKGENPPMGPGLGNGTDLGSLINLYLIPFNRDMPTGGLAQTRGRENTFTEWASSLGDRVADSYTAGTQYPVPLERWTPAKVQVVSGGNNKTVATSAITGRRYLKYNKTSRQISFGASAATPSESETDAFTAIRTALQPSNTNAKILHIPESA
jgi:hypothetical protein